MESFDSFTYVAYFFIGTVVLSTIIWLLALVDIVRSEYKGQNDKIVWAIVVALTGIFGAIIYFIFGIKQKINKIQ